MAEQPKRAGSPAASAAWAFLAACLYLIVGMDRTVAPYDEGIILTGAARVLAGAVPHRDFYANYGPGQFYGLALLFKIFGPSVLIERVWDAAVRASIVSLVLLLASRMSSRLNAGLVAGVCCIWLGALGFYAYPVFPALACALAGQVFLGATRTGKARTALLLGGGACMGMAAMFRYDVGVAGLACALASVTAAWWLGVEGVGRRASALMVAWALVVAGFGVLILPLFAGYLAFGIMPGFVFDILTYPVHFYARMRALPFPTLGHLAAAFPDVVVYLPVLAGIAACLEMFEKLRVMGRLQAGTQRQAAAAWLADILSFCVFSLAFFLKGCVRVSPVHMTMALVVCLIVLAALFRPMSRRGLPALCFAMAAVALAVHYTIFALEMGAVRGARNLAWAGDRTSWAAPDAAAWPPSPEGTCNPPAELRRLRCFRVSPELAQTIRFMRQNTQPGDPVFVGLPRHDIILMNDVLLYFALDRPPATRWYHFDPGLQTSLPIQEEMISEFRRNRTRYVIIETLPERPPEPNGSSISSNVTLLDDVVRRSCKAVAQFGAFSIRECNWAS